MDFSGVGNFGVKIVLVFQGTLDIYISGEAKDVSGGVVELGEIVSGVGRGMEVEV